MEQYLEHIFAGSSFLILTGLVVAALFFAMAGLREVKEGRLEGFLYLVLFLFFSLAHLFLVFNITPANRNNPVMTQPDLWTWLIFLVAPALIILYLGLGLFNLMASHFRVALVKTFFGLTLVCYLYMLGPHWPVDVRGILVIIWGWMWFNLELETAC